MSRYTLVERVPSRTTLRWLTSPAAASRSTSRYTWLIAGADQKNRRFSDDCFSSYPDSSRPNDSRPSNVYPVGVVGSPAGEAAGSGAAAIAASLCSDGEEQATALEPGDGIEAHLGKPCGPSM